MDLTDTSDGVDGRLEVHVEVIAVYQFAYHDASLYEERPSFPNSHCKAECKRDGRVVKRRPSAMDEYIYEKTAGVLVKLLRSGLIVQVGTEAQQRITSRLGLFCILSVSDSKL